MTPFRYPGSKNKLLKTLRVPLDKIIYNGDSFSDAFVGGGSVLLDVATRHPQLKLFANDKDRWVYCFWKLVSRTDRRQLEDLFVLMKSSPTIDLFNELRQPFDDMDEVGCAYRCIFFNRTTFSGIASSGPIGGQAQKSKWTVDCRYNADRLIEKIEACHMLLSGRTTVENCDILEYKYLTHGTGPVYLDPPYYVKGGSLYNAKMSGLDHKKLADTLLSRDGWVLSYDDCPEIQSLYARKKTSVIVPVRYCINGEKSDWKSTGELIITS